MGVTIYKSNLLRAEYSEYTKNSYNSATKIQITQGKF